MGVWQAVEPEGAVVESGRRRHYSHLIAAAASIVALVAVVWIDLATGLWQEVVILSGVAAGLVTFALTALFLERWLSEAEHRRWLPITRLALEDILRALSVETLSDAPARIPRSLPPPPAGERLDHAGAVLRLAATERSEITAALARWAAFLAASGDVRELMVHVAAIAEQLDEVERAAVAELGRGDPTTAGRLDEVVAHYNVAVAAAVAEARGLLDAQRAAAMAEAERA